MTSTRPPIFPHRLATFVLCLALLVIGDWSAQAQDARDERPAVDAKATELPEVDPAFLDPLKALVGDEVAFVDKVWEMGNLLFERISTLNDMLAHSPGGGEAKPLYDEMLACVAKLKSIAEFGIKSYDHNARVQNFNGTVHYDALGDPLNGVKAWTTAVSLDSKYSDPYNNLGMHYFHAGNYPLGFQNMDRALELEPKNPDYCYNMAQNYLIYRPQTEAHCGWDAKRVYKEAMKLSKKATKYAPDDFEILQDYAVNFLAAENFGEKPDWKGAVKAWQAARKHAPEKVDIYYTWLNEGRAWRALGDKKESRRCFETALHHIPENVEKGLTQRLLDEVSEKP